MRAGFGAWGIVARGFGAGLGGARHGFARMLRVHWARSMRQNRRRGARDTGHGLWDTGHGWGVHGLAHAADGRA